MLPTGHVFIATSLDGYIAREDGDIQWLLERDREGEDHGYDDFIENIDTVLMGRGTFEAVRTMGDWFYNRPVLVLSSHISQRDVPPELMDKVRVTAQRPKEALESLYNEGARRVYIDGGQLIQSCLQLGLIDDIVITRVPVMLGKGRPLFGSLANDISLTHEGTKHFPSGLVQSTYSVVKDNNVDDAA